MSNRIPFIDQIGRTVLGELVEQTDTQLVVRNPAMINVNQLQNGQLQVQIFPLYFTEFIAESERTKGTVWRFNLSQVSIADALQVDTRISEQYDRVFGAKAAPTTAEPSVIKLFDDK